MKTNPYPGLRPYEEKDTWVFFGREQQVKRLESVLKERKFVTVVGPSGCGKTSLLNAGLFPKLNQARNQISTLGWDILKSTPLASPFKQLAIAISKLYREKNRGEDCSVEILNKKLMSAPFRGVAQILEDLELLDRGNILIFIDQFEELFAQGGDDFSSNSLKKHFLGLLADTVNSDTKNLYMMIAMRSEFIARMNMSKKFLDLLENSLFIVPEIDELGLYSAIQDPAETAGISVDSDSVSNLIEAVADNQDKLPLIQSYISLLWRKEVSPSPGSISALQMKGPDPGGTINKFADDIYNKGVVLGDEAIEWSIEKKNVTKYILSSICKRDIKGERVRNPLTINEISEMTGIDARKIEEVADILRHPKTGLVKPFSCKHDDNLGPNYKFKLERDADKLDIPHESLIRNWRKLGSWVDQDASSARIYHQISIQAVRWHFTDISSQKEKILLKGMALNSAVDWKENIRTEFRDKDDNVVKVILDQVSEKWLEKNSKPLTRIDLEFDETLYNKCKSKSVTKIRNIAYAFIKESKNAESDAIRRLKIFIFLVGGFAIIAMLSLFVAIFFYNGKQEEIKKKDTEMYLGIASNLARSIVEDDNRHPDVRMLIGLATLNHLVLVPVEEKRGHADICKTIHQAYTDYGEFLAAKGKFKSDPKKNHDWFCKLSNTAVAKEKYKNLNNEICSLVTINITLSEWSKATNRDYRSFDTICVEYLDGIHMEIINSLQLGAEIDVEKGVVKSYWEAKLIEVKVSGDVEQKSFMDRSKKVHEAWKGGDNDKLEKLAKTDDHKKLVAYMQSEYFENLALTINPMQAQKDLLLQSEEPIKQFLQFELISIVTDVVLSKEPTLSHVRRKIPEKSWDKSGGDKAIAHAMAPVCLCGLAYEKVDEVYNICDSAVTLSGNEDSPFQRNRGLAHALRGDFDEALDDYEGHLKWIKDEMSFRRVNWDRKYLIDDQKRTVAAKEKIQTLREKDKFSISDDVKGNIKKECDVSAWESG